MIDRPHSSDEGKRADDDSADSKMPIAQDETGSTNTESNDEHEDEPSPAEFFERAKNWAVNVAGPKIKPVIVSPQFWTALATVAIAVATCFYTHYAKKQLEVIGSQLDVMRGRPWLSIVDHPKIENAVMFDANGSPYADVIFTIRNGGNAPARAVEVSAGFREMQYPQSVKELSPECDDATFQQIIETTHAGDLILPTVDDMKQTMVRVKFKSGDRPNVGDKVQVFLVGCIGFAGPGKWVFGDPLEYKMSFIEQFVTASGDQDLDVFPNGRIPGMFKTISWGE